MLSALRLLALLCLPLAGCALHAPQRTQPAPVSEQSSSDMDLLAQARVLRYSGRYAESMQRLETALAMDPDNSDLRNEWIQTERAWSQLTATLSDRLLAIEAGARLQRRSPLEQLVRATPQDPELRRQLDALLIALHDDAEKLAQCGRRQNTIDQGLARECLRLALRHRDDPKDRELLAALTPASPPKPPKVAPRPATPAAEAAAAKPHAAPPEMIKAGQLVEQGKYFGAVRLLEQLHNKGQQSAQSKALLERAQATLEQETTRLLNEGDALYRDGEVRQALLRWQAALAVNPYSQSARDKTERGLKVLSNLQALKKHQAPGSQGNSL